MSGHSKWSQIKRQKGAVDAQKSKVFTRIAKIIALAARKGENPDMNFELRSAIEKARAVNMPSDSIKRAVDKGSGKSGEVQLESVRYEAYGPGGVAIIIEGITDSKNRTSAEIKHILTKSGAKWAETGSVIWAFEKINPPAGEWTAKTTVEINEKDAEQLDKILEELDNQDDVQELYTNAL